MIKIRFVFSFLTFIFSSRYLKILEFFMWKMYILFTEHENNERFLYNLSSFWEKKKIIIPKDTEKNINNYI